MNVFARQALLNEATRNQWDLYQPHRDEISEILNALGQRKPGGTMAVLGAGNGNDLDLQAWAKHYSKIHLFDFDPNALAFLEEKQLQEPAAKSKFAVEPAVDLSGIAKILSQLTAANSGSITEPFVAELSNKARDPQTVLPGQQFDWVVSSCMLTQLLGSVLESFGDTSPWKNPMMIAVRDGHLKLMSRMLKPNGVGLLITDFVSSDTLPELKQAETKEEVLQLSQQAIEQKNFFTGTNPFSIKESLKRMLVETPSRPWTIEPPWRWQIGADRFYLATAIGFSKSF